MKTVCPQGRVGSNPTLSANMLVTDVASIFFASWAEEPLRESGEVPKLAEGTPLERVLVVNSGAGVQIPPSPFDNSSSKFVEKKFKKLLTTND